MPLTVKQRQVIELVRQGKTLEEAAQEIYKPSGEKGLQVIVNRLNSHSEVRSALNLNGSNGLPTVHDLIQILWKVAKDNKNDAYARIQAVQHISVLLSVAARGDKQSQLDELRNQILKSLNVNS